MALSFTGYLCIVSVNNMNKRELLTNCISMLDKVEDFYKNVNKKLNANKLSKKIESLIKKRIDVLKLLSPRVYKRKIKSLFNKKLDLPNYLTADSFSKGIRLFIENKYGFTSKVKEKKEEG